MKDILVGNTMKILSLITILLVMTPMYSPGDVLHFVDGMVLHNEGWRREDLWVSDGHVVEPCEKADKTIDCRGYLLAPGYIDLQINGAIGCDFTDDPSTIKQVAAWLPTTGVTSFCPTFISSLLQHYGPCLEAVHQAMDNGEGSAAVLGAHLEGPFISKEARGAHCLEAVTSSARDSAEAEDFIKNLSDVALITMAPDHPFYDALSSMALRQGIVVSLGHTNADHATFAQALEKGATLCTHLFNAMPSLHHRHPGPIAAVLLSPQTNYSMIVDGIHLDPLAVRLAYRCHSEGLILVTDAMSAAGMASGRYVLGNRPIIVDDKGAARVIGADTLAGSTLTMDRAVRNLHEQTLCSIEEALRCASEKPARLLGIYPTRGSLAVGSIADIVLLDEQLNVISCWVKGIQRCKE